MPRNTKFMANRFRVAGYDQVVGHRLRELRIAATMSQEQVAAEIGVSFQQVQKYERGANRISLALGCRLAEVFRVPLATIACVEASDTAAPVDPIRLGRARTVVKLDALPVRTRQAITNLINALSRKA